MPFTPPFAIPERIHLFGPTGVGKSRAYLDICRTLAQYGSPAKFRIVTTDNGIMRMIYGTFRDIVPLLEIMPGYTWKELLENFEKAKAASAPGDWLIVDLACVAWDLVQEEYTDRVYSKGLDEFFTDVRAAAEKARKATDKKQGGPPLDGMRDWPTIKKMWRVFAKSLLVTNHCNVLVCCKSKVVNSAFDPPEMLQEYGRIGARPEGNKFLAYDCDSSIYLSRRDGAFVMRTHKDRDRNYVDQVFENFATSYLYGVAGWQVG